MKVRSLFLILFSGLAWGSFVYAQPEEGQAPPPDQPPPEAEVVILDDFEGGEAEWKWDGMAPDHEHFRSGEAGGLWDTATEQVTARDIVHNWTAHDRLTFWCYSPEATGARLLLILWSENPDTDGWDYYWTLIDVDWTEWREFSIPKRAFIATREPSWNHIEALSLASGGWDIIRPVPGTLLTFDDFALRRDPPAPQESLIISDMEADLYGWNGLEAEKEIVKEGRQAGAWRDTVATPEVANGLLLPHDWSGYDFFEFWAYAEVANGAQITLLFFSDSEATPGADELDYYFSNFLVDWTGWKRFRLRLRDLPASRQPRGWDQIDRLVFSAIWSGQAVLADTVLVFDDLRLTRERIALRQRQCRLLRRTAEEVALLWEVEATPQGAEPWEVVVSIESEGEPPARARLVGEAEVTLPPGQPQTFQVEIALPATRLIDFAGLGTQGFRLTVASRRKGGPPYCESLFLPALALFFEALELGPRPRLFLSSDDLGAQRAKREAKWAGRFWNELVQRSGWEGARAGREMSAVPRYVLLWSLDVEAVAYRLSGEPDHLATCQQLIQAILEWPTWLEPENEGTGRQWDLRTCNIAGVLGRAYDLLYEDLSAELRERIRAALLDRALRPLQVEIAGGGRDATRFDCNWACLFLGGNGVAALALLGDEPQVALLLADIVPRVQRILETIGPGGGWQEGFTYRDYGLAFLSQFMDALRRVTGGRVDLFQHPFWRAMGPFSLYGALSPTAYINFSDCDYPPYNRALLFKLAAETRDPHLQWLALHQWPSRYADPFQFLWYDPTLPPELPQNLPTAKHFPGVDWVVLRDGWGDEATVFALRSGYRGPHAHLDANSFLLQAYGERFLVDMGRGVYHQDYFHSTKRWLDYHNGTIGHNTLLIDGQNQTPGPNGGHIATFETHEEYDYVVADATETYAGAQKVRRHVVFLKPTVFVLLDEVRTEEPARIESLLHPASKRFSVAENTIRIEGDRASLLVHVLAPDPVAIRSDQHPGEEPFLRVAPPDPTADLQFLMVLYPLRAKAPEPTLTCQTEGQDVLVRVQGPDGEDTVTFVGLAGEATDATQSRVAAVQVSRGRRRGGPGAHPRKLEVGNGKGEGEDLRGKKGF
jgi:hypothetical protein